MLQPPAHPAIESLTRPATRESLLVCLDALGIAHRTHDHRPVFTVDEGRDLKAELPGGHTKNLFVFDRRGAFVLICALGETEVRLNRVHRLIGCDRLSFASAEALRSMLGVEPGSVSVFALVNDPERRVRLVLDAALLRSNPVNFHPLRNDATTAISTADLLRFVEASGRRALEIDFAALSDPTSKSTCAD